MDINHNYKMESRGNRTRSIRNVELSNGDDDFGINSNAIHSEDVNAEKTEKVELTTNTDNNNKLDNDVDVEMLHQINVNKIDISHSGHGSKSKETNIDNTNTNPNPNNQTTNDHEYDGPPLFDPNATFPDDEDEEEDENQNESDDDDDEENLPRTRARSKSVMDRYEPENDKGIILIDAATIQELAAAAAANATGEGALLNKPLIAITERKGPLQPREVEALQKVCITCQ